MKKIISAMLFCAPFSALAAPDTTVNLTFQGTLTQPTCTASFVGTNANDIAFGSVNASDIIGKRDNSVITAAPVKDVAVQFSNCGGGVSRLLVSFSGPKISGYGFINKAPSFLNPQAQVTGLGFALFTDKTKTAVSDAIGFTSEVNTLQLSSLSKTGEVYKWPLYAKMVVTRDTLIATSADINANSAGRDLTATATVNVVYE